MKTETKNSAMRVGSAACALLSLVLVGNVRTPAAATHSYVSNRIIVTPKPGMENALKAHYQKHKFKVKREFKEIGGMQVIELEQPGDDVPTAIKELEAAGLVAHAQPSYIYHAFATPNDTQYANQWNLNNTGQGGGTSDADIDGPEAWDIRTSASSIIVGVLDSGIRLTHEDLSANLWVNSGEIAADGIDNDGNGYIDDVNGINSAANPSTGNPNDDFGHGTHVSGIIGAVGNNAKGVSGVAWQVKLMALKCLDANGSGDSASIVEGIAYARQKGAHIINASLGGYIYDTAFYNAINSARTAGIIFVAAAGNDGNNNDRWFTFPANYPLDNIVSVAASTFTDTLAYYSSYGYQTVEIAAPGGEPSSVTFPNSEIFSTWYASDTSYEGLAGTSMAAPHVAGALALLKAAVPSEGYQAIIYRLLGNVDVLAAFKGKCISGGRLNIQKALNSTTQSAPPNDSFANRITINGTAVTTFGRNVGATKESGEPNHAGNVGGKSVWWSWTAPASGKVEVTTAKSTGSTGGAFNTLLAVYTGTAVNSLTTIASNDDGSLSDDGSTTSRLTFTAAAGTTYQIAADGNGGVSGFIKLAVHFSPENDDLASATKLAGNFIAADAVNIGATKQTSENSHGGNTGGRSVWWSWKAPISGTFILTTHGSTFDTTLGVYTGGSFPLTQVAGNDNDSSTVLSDDYGGKTSAVSFSASEGQLYYIAVDGVNGQFGNIVLAGGYQYSITSMPAFPVGSTVDLKADGSFVGFHGSGGNDHAYRYNGIITDLGTLGGNNSYAYGQNNSGSVVGVSGISNGTDHGFIWSSGSGMVRLDSSSDTSGAYAINDSGIAVGAIWDHPCPPGNNTYYSSACYWTGGTYTPFPVPTGTLLSSASDINNLGEAVGNYMLDDGSCNPVDFGSVLWEMNVSPISRKELKGFHDAPSTAGGNVIHTNGIIAGAIALYYAGNTHAARWAELRPQEQGTLGGGPSIAYGINGRNQMVGTYVNGKVSSVTCTPLLSLDQGRAVFIQNEVLLDLNRLIPAQTPGNGWEYLEAGNDLNDDGLIMGRGRYTDLSYCHADGGFIMTPPTVIRLHSATRSANDFIFSIRGPASLTCSVDATTDLLSGSWSSLGTISLNSGGVATFTDTSAISTYNNRFYRVKSQSGSKLSINAVGFVTKQLPGAAYALVANPFDRGDNRIRVLFAGLPNGTQVYKWDPSTASYRSTYYLFGTWSAAESQMTMEPGEAVYVRAASASSVTFIGEIKLGSLKNELPSALVQRGSQVPISGNVDSVLRVPIENGDKVHKYDQSLGNTVAYTYNNGTWSPSTPSIALGEGFWTEKLNNTTWRQNLSVW